MPQEDRHTEGRSPGEDRGRKDAPWEASDGAWPCWHLDLHLGRYGMAYNQGIKPPSLWYFVTVVLVQTDFSKTVSSNDLIYKWRHNPVLAARLLQKGKMLLDETRHVNSGTWEEPKRGCLRCYHLHHHYNHWLHHHLPRGPFSWEVLLSFLYSWHFYTKLMWFLK